MSSQQLIDAAILTVFAREILEGSIIIAEYRTIAQIGGNLEPGLSKEKALRAITVSSLCASTLAVVVIFAVAVPLGLLSKDFDTTTSEIIEGVSKIVASVCMLQLSLKLPKWLGFYGPRKGALKTKKLQDEPKATSETSPVAMENDPELLEQGGGVDEEQGYETATDSSEADTADYLTLRSIRFNIAWNIWREVAECGVFLIPSFLAGDLIASPLSAFIGIIIGGGLGYGIYYTNQRLQAKKMGFSIFVILLVSFLSAGLITDGVHNLENETVPTRQVWAIPTPSFWDDQKIPMTFLEPFGYSSSRSVLQIVIFWSWLALLGLLHFLNYKRYAAVKAGVASVDEPNRHNDTIELGDSLGSESPQMDPIPETEGSSSRNASP